MIFLILQYDATAQSKDSSRAAATKQTEHGNEKKIESVLVATVVRSTFALSKIKKH